MTITTVFIITEVVFGEKMKVLKFFSVVFVLLGYF